MSCTVKPPVHVISVCGGPELHHSSHFGKAWQECNPDSQVVLVVKNPPASAGDIRDVGLVPGSGRSPGEVIGNPLEYSCLENPIDRGAWAAVVHGGHKKLDMTEVT